MPYNLFPTPPEAPWLDPVEQRSLCQLMLEVGIIRRSNARDLPLKSGGKTDIYINARDARSNPHALEEIARAYENPLRRLRLDRFAEVPDAVSCFAGVISTQMRTPYITIREEAKAGRVTKGKIIGAFQRGERIALLDDVITDGASKVVPWRECISQGINVPALVVLVDRQQGWQKKFVAEDVKLPVWPGMTLHDVRRYLIESGTLIRCDKATEDRNPIIVALDGKSWSEILPTIDQLRTTGCKLKANDLLFNQGIERLLPDLQVYGDVMADLKAHDISNTVANTCQHLRACPPWAVTVHASGGGDMVKAAVQALEGTRTKVLAITILTSMDTKTCEEIYRRRPWGEVRKLAEIAFKAGAHGFVCSPQETRRLLALYPNAIIVNPGVRSEGADVDDQKRISTPTGAMAAGASNIVLGRQLFGTPDPVAEVHRVLKEELGIAA